MPYGIPKVGRVSDAVKARLGGPAVAPDVVAAVLTRYGLRPTSNARNLAQGWRSAIVAVDTNGGRKVVKAYRSGWDQGAIQHEHSVIRELERVGFPAVRVCAGPDGETIQELAGVHFVVFDFVRGVNLASMRIPRGRRQSLLVRSATTLAELHDALVGFRPSGRHHLDEAVDIGSEWYMAALEDLSHREAHTEFERALSAKAESLGDRIAELAADVARYPYSWTTIHGDFGLHNLLFTSGGEVVVHDFELARRERRMTDLVIVLGRLPAELRPLFHAEFRKATVDECLETREPLEKLWELHALQGAVRSWRNYAELGSEARLQTALKRLGEADRVARREAIWWM